MGLLAAALGGFRATSAWDVTDPRWYQEELGGVSSSAVGVSPETLFNCGVVLAAVRFRADLWSQSQPSVVRRVGQGRREYVDNHYAQTVLRDPCVWMTGVRWRHLMMIRAQLGNAYALIEGGPTSFVDELRPTTRIKIKDQNADGRLVYEYRPQNGPVENLGQERVLHFRGFSTDGVQGLAMHVLLRNAVGIALLAERHTATFLRKGSRIAGLLIPTGDIGGKEKRKELADSVNEAFGGPENTGTMGVLPWQVDFKPISMDNQKAQLLELRDFQVGDILRFLGVPGVVVNWGEKTATFASAEQFFEEARRCVLPWVVNFEAEEEKALLPRGSNLSIKHNLDAVLRADTEKRYRANFQAAGGPWMTGNEIRAIEDQNPITDDPRMDKVGGTANTNVAAPEATNDAPEDSPKPPPQFPPKKPMPEPPPDDGEADAVARLRFSAAVAWTDIAARVVRREVSGLRVSAAHFARDPAGWRKWLAGYYDKHAAHMAEALHVSEAQAQAYTDEHREALISSGLSVVETWEAECIPRLASLALGED
jgi:HK97 family phage portal protein